jgi:hypothetical protein
MPITLVVEDGSGLHNANSYVSVADANTFNTNRPFATSWLAVGLEDKNRAITMATRLLDEHINWYGQAVKTRDTSVSSADRQALMFPRNGLSDADGYAIDHKSVPTWLKEATSEFARYLAVEDRTLDFGTAGFSEIKLGSLNLKVDADDRVAVIPRGVAHMVGQYGRMRYGASSRLVRV